MKMWKYKSHMHKKQNFMCSHCEPLMYSFLLCCGNFCFPLISAIGNNGINHLQAPSSSTVIPKRDTDKCKIKQEKIMLTSSLTAQKKTEALRKRCLVNVLYAEHMEFTDRFGKDQSLLNSVWIYNLIYYL